jgi:hypothetical protein
MTPASACLVDAEAPLDFVEARRPVQHLRRSQSIRERRLHFSEDLVRYKHVYGMAKGPAGALRNTPAAEPTASS